MWDSEANGYARGDGVAAVILKTLSQAIADGDHIECVIRETAFNQDGATTGITMPSATAQQALIRATYAKAGLDLDKPSDRPQFFEAHGTGTPAGDPIEAEAIARAFYGDKFTAKVPGEPLYVGSIKTILGHTEGTAGVAALLKASLAIQNSEIPPNMLLNNLSDKVTPFTKNLEILKNPIEWPTVVPGQPRRASVNSFGFGGANAHAILESYEPKRLENGVKASETPAHTPFVFSASSRQALRSNLTAYADYLEANNDVNLRDLAFTLQQRRSALAYRFSLAATSVTDLVEKLRAEVADTKVEEFGTRHSTQSDKTPGILGVFTGQGSQYARMGAELLEKSAHARSIIEKLQGFLDELPKDLRPDFSLAEELKKAAAESRVLTGAFSFMATVVQIICIDLLKLAGVKFSTIVAHSSGEMAAAYAAERLNARDAMCVSYFRGRFAGKMESPNGPHITGAMMAAGMSPADAEALCEDPVFAGRLCIAAVNSSSSVTLSGDEDAIDECKELLDDEKKFNRKLRVDRAYHSSHVLKRLNDYVDLIKRVDIQAAEPGPDAPLWISSVYVKPVTDDMGMSNEYWGANVAQSVKFYQALQMALDMGEYAAIVEVGPHPALKGPATQTISEITGQSLPYFGVLNRGTDASVSLASTLGQLWRYVGSQNLDLSAFELAMNEDKAPLGVLKGLPAYQWNHDNSYRHESRAAKKQRNQTQEFNELLGTVSPSSAPHHLSWNHLLRVSELTWVQGHKVQTQTVFPAAGYICTAIEGGRVLAGDRPVTLFELKNFVIHQALTFNADDAGIEVQIALSDIKNIGENRVSARFTYSSDVGEEDLALVAEAQLDIVFGESADSTLPTRLPKPPHMISVDNERFYNVLATLGYGFEDAFKSLHSLKRKLGSSICAVKSVSRDTFGTPLLVHPAELDGGIQSLILGYSYPDDDQLRNMHLPTSVANIRVNPALCQSMSDIVVDSRLGRTANVQPGFAGDVSFYINDSACAAIQMQKIELVPLGGLSAKDDRKVFSKYHWIQNKLQGDLAASDTIVTKDHEDILQGLERISTYYLHKLDSEVPADSPLRKSDSPHSYYLSYARHITNLVRQGSHEVAKKEWLSDTFEDLKKATEKYSNLIDYQMMHLVGQQMPRVFKGETNMLEEMRVSDILDNYYGAAFGSKEAGLWIGKTIAQLAERYPHMNILEVGAGTGGATRRVIQNLDSRFLSYTFTDVSSGFFEGAADMFSVHKDRMVFKTFDCGQDPVQQGYVEGSYDVVVAFLVIHATPDLDLTMRNIRKLLKPGGILVVGEGTNNGQPYGSAGFIFGSLPGWWLGADSGRPLSPFVSYQEWERLLKASGFSGIDSTAPQSFQDVLGMTVFAAQAVDETVSFLREPLALEEDGARYPIQNLVVIGGDSDKTKIVEPLTEILKHRSHKVHSFKKPTDVDFTLIDSDATVVCLSELDKPVFQDLTTEEWNAFRALFTSPCKLFWLTSGRLSDEPFSNMTVGFARTAVFETPALQFQNIEVPDLDTISATDLAEKIMRFHASATNQARLGWPIEPEILINAQGQELVPRVRHIEARNNRYNSARRAITNEADVSKFPVSLSKELSGWKLQELSKWAARSVTGTADEEDLVSLHVSHAVLSTLRTSQGHQFLVLGTQSGSDTQYLALVSSLLSIVKVSKGGLIPVPKSELSIDELLTVVATRLVSMSVIDNLVPGSTVIVHNASPLFAEVMESQGSSKGVRTVFAADATVTDIPDSWVSLQPWMTEADIKHTLPAYPACFIGLSAEGTSENARTILSSLPPHCQRLALSDLYSQEGWKSNASAAPVLGQLLKRAVTEAGEAAVSRFSAETISIGELVADEVSSAHAQNPLTVIDWELQKKHPVQVNRLDSAAFFKEDKTYWLCGLSGALGVSLCDWMIACGAKHLVLTSRNPNIAKEWIDNHRSNGVFVTIVPCDVTNEPALRAAHKHICETQPPISGVLNGAMVLRDVSIQNMSFELMSDVFRPKVYGSIHLDRIFKNEALDFFILFSSINCVIGNLGQANYAAANTFMCSLAAQRRERGLAATALNVGAIIGAGYMERESSKALDLTVSKMALMHLSEQDYHQLFAEGIDAGQPGSGDEAELITGLLDIPAAADNENTPRWHANPAFLDFIVHQVEQNGTEASNEAVASVKDQLAGCKSADDVHAVTRGKKICPPFFLLFVITSQLTFIL